jgi:hypothetical protein
VTKTRGCRRARARNAWPLLALLGVLGEVGCGREAPRQAPPQNGKPAESAPAQPEGKEEEQSVRPSPLEKDRAADEAPAAAPFAPPPPATPAPSSAKPDEQTRRRQTPPAKRARPNGRGAAPGADFAEAPLTPQLLRQRLDDAVKLSTPDCPSARDRKQAICDLANQICQLVDRDPDVASVESYCDDARQRCNEAGRRTAQRCR